MNAIHPLLLGLFFALSSSAQASQLDKTSCKAGNSEPVKLRNWNVDVVDGQYKKVAEIKLSLMAMKHRGSRNDNVWVVFKSVTGREIVRIEIKKAISAEAGQIYTQIGRYQLIGELITLVKMPFEDVEAFACTGRLVSMKASRAILQSR